ASRFDIEFVFDGAAAPASPVVARFLDAVRDAAGHAE
ncbi:LysR family transcriptional regulator, partial [Paraburkholderia sp. SIMBA_027]